MYLLNESVSWMNIDIVSDSVRYYVSLILRKKQIYCFTRFRDAMAIKS